MTVSKEIMVECEMLIVDLVPTDGLGVGQGAKKGGAGGRPRTRACCKVSLNQFEEVRTIREERKKIPIEE